MLRCTLTRHAICWRKSRADLSRLAAANQVLSRGRGHFSTLSGQGEGIQKQTDGMYRLQWRTGTPAPHRLPARWLQCHGGSAQGPELFERGNHLMRIDFAQAIVMAEAAGSR